MLTRSKLSWLDARFLKAIGQLVAEQINVTRFVDTSRRALLAAANLKVVDIPSPLSPSSHFQPDESQIARGTRPFLGQVFTGAVDPPIFIDSP